MPGTLRLRWIGHLAIFVALVLLLTACKSALVHVFLSRWSDGAQYLADKILRLDYVLRMCERTGHPGVLDIGNWAGRYSGAMTGSKT